MATRARHRPPPEAPAFSSSPERYILQSFLHLSHAPVWQGGGLESRAVLLRVVMVADGQGDYHVLPGGLTRPHAGQSISR